MNDWRTMYQQIGKPVVPPIDYIPIPGSIECHKAVTRRREPDNSEGDEDDHTMLQDWL